MSVASDVQTSGGFSDADSTGGNWSDSPDCKGIRDGRRSEIEPFAPVSHAPQTADPDRPSPTQRSDEQVLHLVDPASFPLVYGRSKVLLAGGVVGREDAMDSVGKNQTAPFPSQDV
jgi:hypothetical protein